MYAAVLTYASAYAYGYGGLVAAIGAPGAVFLAVVLARGVEELLPWALFSLGGAYAAAAVAHGGAVDGAAPLAAAGLLLCGELGAWSLDERWAIPVEPPVVRRRALALAGLVAAGLAASALVVGLAAVPAGRGLPWTATGAAAAVAVVALAVVLSRRGGERRDEPPGRSLH